MAKGNKFNIDTYITVIMCHKNEGNIQATALHILV